MHELSFLETHPDRIGRDPKLEQGGGSLSFGPRGAKLTIGPRGTRATVGLPGTGLFYTTTLPAGGRKRTPATPKVRPQDRLTLGFFKRLITPDDEEALVDGCRELVLGHEEEGLRKGSSPPCRRRVSCRFPGAQAGAATYLATAAEQHRRLGRYFAKYGIAVRLSLPITDEVSAQVGPDLRGLGLLEAARETLTSALRRKKGRSEEPLRARRDERARVYETLGQRRRARRELEKLYAEALDGADAAARLGLAVASP